MSQPPVTSLTILLRRMAAGDREAASAALEMVYPELRLQAARMLRREQNTPASGATALVHELWMQKIRNLQVEIADRQHFFRLCARGFRQILRDQARARLTQKRRGEGSVTTAGDIGVEPGSLDPETLLTIGRLLDQLELVDPRAVAVVDLKYFMGCSWEEAAETLAIHTSEARRDWAFAQAWLRERIERPGS